MVNYNREKARDYGIRFGNSYENGIFKRMNGDCTNFICQCVWAAYGGTDGYTLTNPEDILVLKNRVENMYRQTPSWYGRSYNSLKAFGSLSFIRVEGFWNFAVNNKSAGPRAIGYNNGKHWTNLNVAVEQGDIIQFYQDPIGRYAHSAIVVSDTKRNIVASMNDIYVAQHSADFSYRPLKDAIEANCNIETCKLRLLKFLPAYF